MGINDGVGKPEGFDFDDKKRRILIEKFVTTTRAFAQASHHYILRRTDAVLKKFGFYLYTH